MKLSCSLFCGADLVSIEKMKPPKIACAPFLLLYCIPSTVLTSTVHNICTFYTGSNTHVPGYHAAYEEIKSLGIDEVYCVSVNDAFVMRQWGLNLKLPEDKTVGANGFETVKMVPDGAAFFTRAMGMSCVWEQERGFGERSWRYSAVIDDMVVEKLFIEGGSITQDSGPDPFEVSDATTMVKYLKESKEERAAKRQKTEGAAVAVSD